MKLKRLQIEELSKPVRLSQQLDKAVTTNYKPVANHSYNLEYDRKKKDEGKRARADKQQVLDMLFSAFEKHQYYNIKDLVDITKQPVVRYYYILFTTITPVLQHQGPGGHHQTTRGEILLYTVYYYNTSITTSRTWWTSPNNPW
uniref:General transcription factor IIF, polypeptide 2a n=1 Tax=Hucho hucho TaxID=62062 RepID=A0A4W5PUA0_9TELE